MYSLFGPKAIFAAVTANLYMRCSQSVHDIGLLMMYYMDFDTRVLGLGLMARGLVLYALHLLCCLELQHICVI